MSAFAVAIPASNFLRQRMAGLSGVARSVILADLEQAERIYVIAADPITPDWQRSFAVRQRPMPDVEIVSALDKIPAAHRDAVVVLPENRLLNRSGIAGLRRGRAAEDLVRDEHYHAADAPGRVTWQILQASMKPGEGWFGRNINRPISFRMSAILLRWNISPNAITWFTFALAILMTVMLAQGGYIWLALGGALYQAVSVIDCVDGDIARVTYQTSRAGAVMDTAFDMLANLGFVFGVMLGVVRTYGAQHLQVAFALVAVAAICMAVMTLLVRLGPGRGSFDVLRAALSRKLAGRPQLQSAVLTFEKVFKRDFYALFAASLCVLGLAWLVPQLGLLGVCIWLGAIMWCAPTIIADKTGELLPSHIKAME